MESGVLRNESTASPTVISGLSFMPNASQLISTALTRLKVITMPTIGRLKTNLQCSGVLCDKQYSVSPFPSGDQLAALSSIWLT